MKREIKFKAWHPIAKFMGDAFKLDWIKTGDQDKPKDWENPSARWDESVIFLQGTNLKDKNDKEIFEGDILKIEPDTNMAVMYCQHQGNWSVTKTPNDPEAPHFILGGKNSDIEIIGNIYENPELLK